jgi:aspartyl-tRNA(Asn)/glutamyl-tRNA(Gln) amidotransferase subunit C
VARQDDRAVLVHLPQERLERRRHVAIGEAQRVARLLRRGQERAEGRLPVAGDVDVADLVERARLAADEDARAEARLVVRLHGRVPRVARDERGRVDEEHRRASARSRAVSGRGPERRVARDLRPGDPHGGIVVGAASHARLRLELGRRHQRRADDVVAEQAVGEGAGDREHDQRRHDVQELAGHGAAPCPNAPALATPRARVLADATMSVDEATVKRIAKLARIAITEEDARHLAPELDGILHWIEQLGEVDTSGVEPMTAVIPNTLRLRDDVVTDGGVRDAVLANAPQAEHGFFTVPKVIE